MRVAFEGVVPEGDAGKGYSLCASPRLFSESVIVSTRPRGNRRSAENLPMILLMPSSTPERLPVGLVHLAVEGLGRHEGLAARRLQLVFLHARVFLGRAVSSDPEVSSVSLYNGGRLK